VFRWTGTLALLRVYRLETRLDRFVAYAALAERPGDRHQRVVLLAERDSPATNGLQRPLAFSPLREAPVKGQKIGSVIFDLEWRPAKCAPGHGEISRMIVNLDLAITDSGTP
jgi:hypothetical protein